MTTFYLAATFSRAKEMQDCEKDLEGLGHSVCSRWIRSQQKFGVMTVETVKKNLKVARIFAAEDIADILTCDSLILFTDMPSSTGGRHTELGLALAFGKYVVIVGQRENIFQAYEGVVQFDNWEKLIEGMREAVNASEQGSTEPRSTETPSSIQGENKN